jgi:hypothetical protein
LLLAPRRGPGAVFVEVEMARFPWGVEHHECHTDAQDGMTSPLKWGYLMRDKERKDMLEPHRPLKLHGGDYSVTLVGGGTV